MTLSKTMIHHSLWGQNPPQEARHPGSSLEKNIESHAITNKAIKEDNT